MPSADRTRNFDSLEVVPINRQVHRNSVESHTDGLGDSHAHAIGMTGEMMEAAGTVSKARTAAGRDPVRRTLAWLISTTPSMLHAAWVDREEGVARARMLPIVGRVLRNRFAPSPDSGPADSLPASGGSR
jgi:hypothetical protein